MVDRSKNLPPTSDVSIISFVQRNVDDATTWIPREDKQSNNQPHLLDNESLMASSLNLFRFRLGILDDDRHGERWIVGASFQARNKTEVNSRYKLLKSVDYI
jgi:hypothetical protein